MLYVFASCDFKEMTSLGGHGCESVCVGAVFMVRHQHPVLNVPGRCLSARGIFLRNLVEPPAIALFLSGSFCTWYQGFCVCFLAWCEPSLTQPPPSWPLKAGKAQRCGRGATWDLGPTGVLYAGQWARPSKIFSPKKGMQFLEWHRGRQQSAGSCGPREEEITMRSREGARREVCGWGTQEATPRRRSYHVSPQSRCIPVAGGFCSSFPHLASFQQPPSWTCSEWVSVPAGAACDCWCSTTAYWIINQFLKSDNVWLADKDLV